MKVLDELKAWLNAERKARNEKKAAKKAAALVRESEAIVQAREFSGEVYVCFNTRAYTTSRRADLGRADDTCRGERGVAEMERKGGGA